MLRLVGVGGTLGISSACIARPSLNGATAALHAEGSRTAAASLLIAAVATPAPSTGPLASALLPRMPASGAAATSLGRRSDGIVGTLPRPSLGASMRFASTATAAEAAAAGGKTNDAPAAAAVVPSAVLVKVGDGGKWIVFEHEKLLSINYSNLLEALAGSKMFALDFKDVNLSACSIAVIKNAALSAGVEEPSAEHEAGDSVVEMKLTKTVGDMANGVGASGAPLFVRVGLPSPPRAPSRVSLSRAAAQLQEVLPFAQLEPIAGEPAGGCELLALYDSRKTPVNWPNLDSNKLLIRPTFREFFERTDMFNSGRRRMPLTELPDTLVRGIPGIGKSSFALYCLWRLVVQDKRNVYYDYPKGLGECDTLEFGSGPLEDSVYIADGLKPRVKAGVALLVSSPHQVFFEEFQTDSEWFFMPEPTEKEMTLLRDRCFLTLSDELTNPVLSERMARWGRVPRMVMRSARSEQAQLKTTLEGLSETPLRGLLLKEEPDTGSKKDMSFRVVHYKFPFDTAADYCWSAGQPASRDYGFASISLRWSTPFMETRIWEFLHSSKHASRLQLLSALFKDKAILSFSGNLWQKWCSVALDRGSAGLPGGGFQVRRLSASDSPAARSVGAAADALLGLTRGATEGSWLLPAPAARSVQFQSLDDLQKKQAARKPSDALCRYVAQPSQFASIDFWEGQLKHPCGSNATVSAVHGLIVQGERLSNGWRAIASSLGFITRDGATMQQGPLIHLWLVPSIVFPHCEAGSLHIASKKRKLANAVDVAASSTGGAAVADATEAAKQGKAAATQDAEDVEEEAALLAFNEAVEQARALAPFIVQYAVRVPTPEEWPQGAPS